MMKQLACALALLLATGALAQVSPNRYECESGKTKLVLGPNEASGSPTLNFSFKDMLGGVSLVRSGDEIQREVTNAGVRIEFSNTAAKRYTLIVPVIKHNAFFQSAQTKALLIESTWVAGQNTNTYSQLDCKASHVVY